MAVSNYYDVLNSSDQIAANHEKYKDKYVDTKTNGIDQETFLSLLVAEMSNQDPLEPTSNTEFISQLAQFSAMQYMQEAGKYSMANYASSLVGKVVTVYEVKGKDVIFTTGEVEKVTKNKDNTFSVTVDGEVYPLERVTSVSAVAPKKDTDGDKGDETTVSSNALGDSIARAAAMVGMFATVNDGEPNEEGVYKIDQGFIEAIRVQDGKIKVVINGKSQPIENIVEFFYATVVEDPENPEAPEAPENPEETDVPEVSDVSGSGDNGSEARGVGTVDFTTGAEDVPDLEDLDGLSEEEAIEQLRRIIESMS